MQYKRISADCHLDLPWMPADLFTSMSKRELKDRMPYVTDTDEGARWVAKNGASFGFQNGVGPAGQKFVPGKHHRVDVMAETGLYDDGKKGIRRVSDPHLRIKDLDRDNVDAEVIYGILGAAGRLNDTEAANHMMEIYNDWLKGFCSHYPDRHIGLACLPYGDVDAAVKEIYRVAKMGLRGLELSCSWDMEPMWHPMWDPLWAAVNDVDLPLHFHTFPTIPPNTIENHGGQVGRRVFFTVVSGFQMNLVNILAAVMSANVFERFPNVRIAFGESGCGWIPYALDRMDFEWEDRFTDLGLKMKPSDYWRRQCKATFQYDRIGAKLIDDMGVESLMWGSDYPHGDGVWPHSDKYIAEQFKGLPEEYTHKITCENAAKFYRLIN
jgi:predicted TIM-barrel fold metal-dependent hydrolase